MLGGLVPAGEGAGYAGGITVCCNRRNKNI